MSTQVEVTLVKAQTYIHQPTGLRFEFETPKIVSAEVAEYLFRNAVKSVKTSSGGRVSREDVRLFAFAPVEEGVSYEDEDESDDPKSATLADALAAVAPVRAPAADAPADTPAKAPGVSGDGQARSRARGAKPAAA